MNRSTKETRIENLLKKYPNVIRNLANYWIDIFQKSRNTEKIEKLFDFLEDKYTQILSWADAQYEDLEMNLVTWEKGNDGKPYVEIYFEKIEYDPEWNEWVRTRKYPLTLRVTLSGNYEGTTDEVNTKKLEDFLEALPEDLNQALV